MSDIGRNDEPETAPTYAEVLETRQVAHDLAQQAADEEPGRVRSIAAKAGKAAAREENRRAALITLLVALIVPLLVSTIALGTSLSTRADVADVQVALTRLDQANAELASRGQPPVALPPNSTPEQVSAAAITAQVVASLPAAPSADEVASRLQGAVIGQLQGPTFGELARLSADYFRSLPAPPGPTEAQIQDAVDRRYAADPPPPGRDGSQGERGADGAPCLPSTPECVGPRGDPGAEGPMGPEGKIGPGGPEGPVGPSGSPGADGRSIVSGPTPVLVGASCVWRTEYDQAPLFEEHPAGAGACPSPPEVPEIPTPPTG